MGLEGARITFFSEVEGVLCEKTIKPGVEPGEPWDVLMSARHLAIITQEGCQLSPGIGECPHALSTTLAYPPALGLRPHRLQCLAYV